VVSFNFDHSMFCISAFFKCIERDLDSVARRRLQYVASLLLQQMNLANARDRLRA